MIERTNAWKQELEHTELYPNSVSTCSFLRAMGRDRAPYSHRLQAAAQQELYWALGIRQITLRGVKLYPIYYSPHLTQCWVCFTPSPLSRVSEDTHPTRPVTLPAAAPRYLCEFPGTQHPVPAWDSKTPGMTQQVVVCSAYESVRIACHWAIQIMEDRHFVTVIIIVSKPLARSAKKHFQSNLGGENKKKNYWLALSKDLSLQCFNSQNSDTARTRKLCCLSQEFCFASSI